MSAGQAISSALGKYATFSGRARRAEFWWFWLFCVLLLAIAAIVDNVAHLTFSGSSAGWIYSIVGILLVIPSISVTFRRLHDTGRSGFWWLLSLICGIGSLILFIMCLSNGTPGENQYGPDPKAA